MQKAGEKPGSIIAAFLHPVFELELAQVSWSFRSFLSKNTWPEQYSYTAQEEPKRTDKNKPLFFQSKCSPTVSQMWFQGVWVAVVQKSGTKKKKWQKSSKEEAGWKKAGDLAVWQRVNYSKRMKHKTKRTHTHKQNKYTVNSYDAKAAIFNNFSEEKLHFANSVPAGNHSITTEVMLLLFQNHFHKLSPPLTLFFLDTPPPPPPSKIQAASFQQEKTSAITPSSVATKDNKNTQ